MKPNIGLSSKLKSIYRDLSNYHKVEKKDKQRILNLRCSQLPFCPLGFFNDLVSSKYGNLDFHGLFYTRVGTTVHEVLQEALPQVTDLMIGDWKCKKCKSVKRFTNRSECCGLPMQYQEVEIDYKGIKGHIDCIIKYNNKYYIVDFKTTSSKGLPYKIRDPGTNYKLQLLAYAVLMKLQYKVKIEGILNLFITRDNPDNIGVYELPITEARYKETYELLKLYRKQHRVILNGDKNEIKKLYKKYGSCSNPKCSVCDSDSPKSVFRKALKAAQYPVKEWVESW